MRLRFVDRNGTAMEYKRAKMTYIVSVSARLILRSVVGTVHIIDCGCCTTGVSQGLFLRQELVN